MYIFCVKLASCKWEVIEDGRRAGDQDRIETMKGQGQSSSCTDDASVLLAVEIMRMFLSGERKRVHCFTVPTGYVPLKDGSPPVVTRVYGRFGKSMADGGPLDLPGGSSLLPELSQRTGRKAAMRAIPRRPLTRSSNVVVMQQAPRIGCYWHRQELMEKFSAGKECNKLSLGRAGCGPLA